MKFSTVLLIPCAVASSVSGTDSQAYADSSIPHCAIGCLSLALAKNGCGKVDYECGCKKFTEIQASATPCVIKACGVATASGKVLPALKDICAKYSVVLEEPAAKPKEPPKEQPALGSGC